MNKIFQNKNYFIKKKNRHVSCAYTGSYIALYSILSSTNNRSRIWKKMPHRHFFFPHKNQLLFFSHTKINQLKKNVCPASTQKLIFVGKLFLQKLQQQQNKFPHKNHLLSWFLSGNFFLQKLQQQQNFVQKDFFCTKLVL